MSSTSLDIEKSVSSLKGSDSKRDSTGDAQILIQDVTPELPRLDRFARAVTNWITQRGLEGHGYVSICAL